MFSRFVKIVITLLLCLTFFPPSIWAVDIESRLMQLEAKAIYEAASQMADNEEYDKTIKRLDWITAEYSGTEYARLAKNKKQEIVILRLQPKPIRGASRVSLVGFGTLFTTWLGIGTLMLLDADDPEPYGLALIAGPISGVIGSLNLTRDSKLSNGQASLINLGGAWGIWQATGAAMLADVNNKAVVGASMAGGIMGFVLSSSIVKGRHISPGDATLINFGGIWGTWFSICGAMVADVQDGDNILASAIIGGDMGLLATAAWVPKLNMSRSRARLINAGGIIGTLYGLGTDILFEIDSGEPAFWGIMGLGGILGLAAGAYLTRKHDGDAGYFAESQLSRGGIEIQRNLLNIEYGEQKWALPLPTLTFSRPNSGPGQIPNLKLQVPLIHIKF